MRVLLSPPVGEAAADWYGRVTGELRTLVAADAASLMVPTGGAPVLYGAGIEPAALRDYERHYWALDFGLRVRRKALGAEVWCRRQLWDRAVLYRSEYYNDFVVPHRLYDAVGFTIEAPLEELAGAVVPEGPRVGTPEGRAGEAPPEGLAGVSFYHRRRDGVRFDRNTATLLGVVVPAFRAGLRTWLRFGGLGRELPRVLDALDAGLLLCDADGRVLHRNQALRGILDRDPERERLWRGIERIADSLRRLVGHGRPGAGWQPGHPVEGSIRTDRGEYGLRGSYIAAGSAGLPSIVVAVEPRTRELPSDEVLHARFGLTPRQAAVARLLARGMSNAAIATTLWISPHTARHHTETVLLKLGAHSRAEVASLLLRYP